MHGGAIALLGEALLALQLRDQLGILHLLSVLRLWCAWKCKSSSSTHRLGASFTRLLLTDHLVELDLVHVGVDGLHLVHALRHHLLLVGLLCIQLLLLLGLRLLRLLPLHLEQLALLLGKLLVLAGHRRLTNADLPLQLLLGLELLVVAHSLLVGRHCGRLLLHALFLHGSGYEDLLLLSFSLGLRTELLAVVLAR